jgi:hypothetical protein
MHGDLSETALFSACDSREVLSPGRCYPTYPMTMGPFCSRSHLKGAGNRPTGVTPADLFSQLPARGSGSAATLGTQPFDLLLCQNDK